MSQDTKEFASRIYELAESIPKGKVASYGQLAALAGRPQNARLAGKALANAPADRPCHRVVNSAGRTVPGWAEQVRLLKAEGITFRPNGCVDMKRHCWQPFK